MKQITTLIIVFFSLFSYGQYNFKASNKDITWMNIFTAETSLEEVFKFCKQNIRHTSEPEIIDNAIYGTTEYSNVIEKSLGLVIAATTDVRYQYKITYNDGKYMVKIRNIEFAPVEVTIMGVTNTDNSALKELALRNKDHTIRRNKPTQRLLERLNAGFTDLFSNLTVDKW